MATAAQTVPETAASCGDELRPTVGGAEGADGGERVLAEPWQAQAFAMTVVLHERGLFTLVRRASGAGVAPGAAAASAPPRPGRAPSAR